MSAGREDRSAGRARLYRATSVGAVSREGGGASVLTRVAACAAWPHRVEQKGVGGGSGKQRQRTWCEELSV